VPLPTWTPDLASLDLLLSVAELGSIGQAAEAHRLSQPSVSARLRQLERQLGIAVLTRTPRGSTLTPAGEAVVAWARPVVEAARSLTDAATALRAGRGARLRVAASLTVAEYLLPRWLLILRHQHAALEIAVSVANSAEVADRVRAGTADLGFVEAPSAPKGLRHKVIGRDRLALVVAASHPLAGRAARLDPSTLRQQALLLREPGSGTRDTFLHALARLLGPDEASRPTPVIELGSTTTIIAAALAGGGIGVVSARAVEAELADGRLVELRAAELDLERPLRAVWLGTTPGERAGDLIAIARRASMAKPR
jgi:DNA-binding transcriptional LysR family regulator